LTGTRKCCRTSAEKFCSSTNASTFRGIFLPTKRTPVQNWYTEPAPQAFDGLTEKEWHAAKAYCDVRHTVSRSYDKYAKPVEPRLLSELSELYAQIASETLKRHLNPRHMYSCYGFDMGRMEIIHAANVLRHDWEQDARERFLNCSYCTYFQRPNLIGGAFQEIMPREDEFAFEIFCRTLERIKPRVVFVLSAQASASIRRLSGGALPYKICLFDSACPADWSARELKIFRREVESIFEAKAAFHLRNWLAATGAADEYFLTAIGEVLAGFDVRNNTPLENLDRLLETDAEALTAQNPDGTLTPWFNCHPLNICPEKNFSAVFGDMSRRGAIGKRLRQN